eukprot:1159144-Pelagomonas_calceolata.AAC.2
MASKRGGAEKSLVALNFPNAHVHAHYKRTASAHTQIRGAYDTCAPYDLYIHAHYARTAQGALVPSFLRHTLHTLHIYCPHAHLMRTHRGAGCALAPLTHTHTTHARTFLAHVHTHPCTVLVALGRHDTALVIHRGQAAGKAAACGVAGATIQQARTLMELRLRVILTQGRVLRRCRRDRLRLELEGRPAFRVVSVKARGACRWASKACLVGKKCSIATKVMFLCNTTRGATPPEGDACGSTHFHPILKAVASGIETVATMRA